MFFVLSKAFWTVARPLNALLLLALAGALLARFGWRRLARTCLAVSAIAIPAIGLTQLPDILLYTLEARIAPVPLPDHPRGIVILGGGLGSERIARPDGYHMGEASDRLIRGLELKRRYPQARLIYSGGLASLTGQGVPEARAALDAIEALYGDDRGVELEARARNTWENAVYAARMSGEPGEGQWILVTSAFHMPRALGCFRKVGFDVVPAPTDFRAEVLRFPFLTGDMANQFLKMNILVKELIGLVAYRLSGRTGELLPG